MKLTFKRNKTLPEQSRVWNFYVVGGPHVFGGMPLSDLLTSETSLFLSLSLFSPSSFTTILFFHILGYWAKEGKKWSQPLHYFFLNNNFVKKKKSFLAWQNFPMALGHHHIAIYNFSSAWNNLPHATLVNDWDTPWWCLTFNSAGAPLLPKQPFPFTLPQRPSNFSSETEIL